MQLKCLVPAPQGNLLIRCVFRDVRQFVRINRVTQKESDQGQYLLRQSLAQKKVAVRSWPGLNGGTIWNRAKTNIDTPLILTAMISRQSPIATPLQAATIARQADSGASTGDRRSSTSLGIMF
jgi:hypothetical protein